MINMSCTHSWIKTIGCQICRGQITIQLPIPKCKSEFSKKSFFPSTIKLWNVLHGTFRDSVNKSSFKKQYVPQSSRLHPEYIQGILHAQPK